ncbi:MAG: tetratricopeptide repeat protein [Candidatus Omnitrophica bacterium]|nr:tetratricopeptide repeat protein [Candidatus Omnitrophota bacterium]
MRTEKIACVSVLTGPLKGREFPVKSDSPVLIGRDDHTTIKIAYDDYCSRKHAIIYLEGMICLIEDLNSANGTLLNNTLIHGKNELKDKDVIGLGDTKLVVSIKDSLKEESIAPDLATNIKTGDSIYGRYEVHHILEAGIGIACVCYDNINQVPYVLKTLQRKYLVSPQSQSCFEKKSLAWIGLGKHPYIVSAYLAIRIENYPFIVLDYIVPDENGRNSLSHLLGNLTLSEILKYSIEFCYGMEHAYAKGIEAHGNIKPNNIMITPDKAVKITDFGFAKLSQEIDFNEHIPEKEDLDLAIFKSNSGVTAGTLPYMAPEQFDGQMNQLSDIYSFGVVLYQMAKAGALPFSGKGPSEYEKAHKEQAAAGFDSPLFAIIKKCLEKDPAKRYIDFAAMRIELQELLLKETGEKITLPEGAKLESCEAMNKGASLYYLGRYEGGIACYDKAIAINPAYSDAYYNRGNAYYDKGDLVQAVSDYSKAIEINPAYSKAYYRRGVFYHSKGNLVLAISDYNKAIEINPAYPDAYYNRGNAYYDKGDLVQAVSDYSKAMEISPKDAKAYKGRGIAHYKKGELELSISDYNKALEINPNDAEAYSSRGIAYYKKGKFDLSISDYNKAIEINPAYPNAYYNRGNAYYDKGDLVQAVSDYNKAIEINPKDAEAYSSRGIAYYKKGDFEEAISDYSRAIAINPAYSKAYCNRGNAYYDKGSFEQAISDYNKAIEINPKDSEVYRSRGVAYHVRGNLEQAVSDYNKAIEINPKDARAYNSRGIAYYKKGDLVQAISDYSNAIEINPKDAEAYNSRGIAYHVRGKLEQAIFDFSRAIAINPEYSKAYCNRGGVHYDKGYLEEAISDYNKAIEINPEYSKAYCSRGAAYFLKKDYDKSWKDVHKAEELGYKIPINLINDLKKASGKGI